MSLVNEVEATVCQILGATLPENLYFHNISHTQNVVAATQIIAEHEKIIGEELEILLLAAWFHDTGYTKAYKGHEDVSMEIAREFLENRGCDQTKLARVLQCISVTRIPQKPANQLEKVICDADLFHLSQADYWDKNNLLKMELEKNFHLYQTDQKWLWQNLIFLKQHHYFTTYGQIELSYKKQQHLIENMKMLAALKH